MSRHDLENFRWRPGEREAVRAAAAAAADRSRREQGLPAKVSGPAVSGRVTDISRAAERKARG